MESLYKNIEEILKESSRNPLIKDQAKNLNIKKLKKVVLGFYGGTGRGKSFAINELIGIEILPTGGMGGGGVTKYPIKCVYHDQKVFDLKTFKDGQSTDVQFDNPDVISNLKSKINELNSNDSLDFEYIQVSIPKNDLKSSIFNEMIGIEEIDIELIDMIGIPDASVKDAEKKNEKVIQNNGSFLLDGIFLLKQLSNDRFRTTPYDFNCLEKCNIFKRTKYHSSSNTPPKVMILCNLLRNEKEDEPFEDRRNNSKESAQFSLKKITKKEIKNEELKKKVEKYEIDLSEQINNKNITEIESEKKINMLDGDESINFVFKTNEFEEMINRVDTFVFYSKEIVDARKKSVENFKECIIEIQEFKEKKYYLSILKELQQIINFSICTIARSRSKSQSNCIIKFFDGKRFKAIKNIYLNSITNIMSKFDIDVYEDCQKQSMIRDLSNSFAFYSQSIVDELSFKNVELRFNDEFKDKNFWGSFFDFSFDKNEENFQSLVIEKFNFVQIEIVIESGYEKYEGLKIFSINIKDLLKQLDPDDNKFELVLEPRKPKLTHKEGLSNKLPDQNLIKELKNKNRNDKASDILKKRFIICKSDTTFETIMKVKVIDNWRKFELQFEKSDLSNFESKPKELDENILIRISKESNKFKIECNKFDQLDKKLKRLEKNIDSLNNKQANLDFCNESISLNPIFIWIKKKTIEDIGKNIYTFLSRFKILQRKSNEKLSDEQEENEKFLIFLFFESSASSNVKFIRYIKIIKAITFFNKNVINVFVEDDLNPKNSKAYMITLAKFFKLQRFYQVDDEINEFFEYNESLVFDKNSTCVRAFYYMNGVLNKGILKEDTNVEIKFDMDEILYQLTEFSSSLKRSEELTEQEHKNILAELKKLDLNNILQFQNFFQRLKSKITSSENYSECDKIENLMNGTNKKFLGQIYLINYKNIDKKEIGTTIYPTHKIVKPKSSDVVLINMESIFGEIFPTENDFSENKYSDDKYDFNQLSYYYGLINGVSNYVVYQFAYDTGLVKLESEKLSEKKLLETFLMRVKSSSENKPQRTTSQESGNLPEIEKWKDLNQIINDFDKNLDDVNKCYDYVPILEIAEILQTEEEYRTYIFNILNTIFNDKLFKNKSLEFKYQNKKNDTDLVLFEKDNQNKRYINIEIKQETVLLCLNQIDLYEYINSNPSNSNPINCVKQVYRYMNSSKVKYAVLTTFNRSWFFKLEGDKLYVSEKIDCDLFLKAMNYLVKISTENSLKRKIDEKEDEDETKVKNVKISSQSRHAKTLKA